MYTTKLWAYDITHIINMGNWLKRSRWYRGLKRSEVIGGTMRDEGTLAEKIKGVYTKSSLPLSQLHQCSVIIPSPQFYLASRFLINLTSIGTLIFNLNKF